MSEGQQLVIADWLPESLSNGQHGHWSTRQKKLRNAQLRVWASARYARLKPVADRARLTITLVFPNQRRRDTDNLYARTKGIIDGLVRGGWIVDDDTEHLVLQVQAVVDPGHKRTELLLEPA